MQKLNGFILICALVIMSSAANAQIQIVIDNQTIPTEDIESIIILPNSNMISVTTTRAYTVAPTVVGSGVAITSFTVSPGTITAGGSATFSWTTENAVSCTASNGVGDWGGSVSVNDSQQITTSTTGTHTFTLNCDGSEVDDTTSRGVLLTVNSANAVGITGFTASPSTITEGESTTLSWTTTNASSCTASNGAGDWGGTVAVNGSQNVTINTANSYSFILTCQDDNGGSDVDSEAVTVNPEAGQCDASPLAGSVSDWNVFWNSSFPGPVYKTINTRVLRNGYKAVKFNTGDVYDYGQILAIENTATPGLITAAFSECPGEFEVEDSDCYYKYRLGGRMTWSTNGRSGACDLKPNTTYYYNMTYTDGFDPETSRCSVSPCTATVQHRNYD